MVLETRNRKTKNTHLLFYPNFLKLLKKVKSSYHWVSRREVSSVTVECWEVRFSLLLWEMCFLRACEKSLARTGVDAPFFAIGVGFFTAWWGSPGWWHCSSPLWWGFLWWWRCSLLRWWGSPWWFLRECSRSAEQQKPRSNRGKQKWQISELGNFQSWMSPNIVRLILIYSWKGFLAIEITLEKVNFFFYSAKACFSTFFSYLNIKPSSIIRIFLNVVYYFWEIVFCLFYILYAFWLCLFADFPFSLVILAHFEQPFLWISLVFFSLMFKHLYI